MPQQLVFVSTDDSARVRPSERRLIRRHCMQQKNKKPDSRRSKREAARAVIRDSHQFEKQDQDHQLGSKPNPTEDRSASPLALSAESGRKNASRIRDMIPPPPPSDWALFHFAEELDTISQKMMHQCTYDSR